MGTLCHGGSPIRVAMPKRTRVFKEISPTKAMTAAAELLKMGKILAVYQDGKAVKMETELNGPYVWRDQKWRLMV